MLGEFECRRKSDVMSGVRYDGQRIVVVADTVVLSSENPMWMFEANADGTLYASGGRLFVKTRDGDHVASPGDVFLRGPDGRVALCRGDAFDEAYEVL